MSETNATRDVMSVAEQRKALAAYHRACAAYRRRHPEQVAFLEAIGAQLDADED